MYNPIVTFAYMIRKKQVRHSLESRWMGIPYVLVQLGGAAMGGMMALMFLQVGGELGLTDSEQRLSGLIAEMCGSFLLVFFYLSQSEQETQIKAISNKDHKQIFIVLAISATYTASIFMVSPPYLSAAGVLNPAIALGAGMAMYFGEQGTKGFKS